MPKKKTKSETVRVPLNQKNKIKQIGDGNFRQGVSKLLGIYEMIQNDPTILLQKELDHFGNMVKAFANDNHYQHYLDSNMPAVLLKFVKTGRIDHKMINNRPEEKLDRFNNEFEKEEK